MDYFLQPDVALRLWQWHPEIFTWGKLSFIQRERGSITQNDVSQDNEQKYQQKNIHELLTHVWWMRDALLAEGFFRCFDLMMLESCRKIKDKDFSVQNPVRKHFKSASQHCWKPSIPNQISPALRVNFVRMQGTNMKRIIWRKDKLKGSCPNLAQICIM